MVEKSFEQGANLGQEDPEGALHKQSSIALNEDELAQKQEELKILELELEESK